MTLDYKITDFETRKKIVEEIIEKEPNLSRQELDKLSSYLIGKPEEKHHIVTPNRMVTINKYETSFEGLSDKFENGDDGVYNLAANGRAAPIRRKAKITAADVEKIPELAQTLEAIAAWKKRFNEAEDKREKYIAKSALIDFYREQYTIKSSYIENWGRNNLRSNAPTPSQLSGKEWVNESGEIETEGVSLCDPKVCSAILRNYDELTRSQHTTTKHLLAEFDALCELSLKDLPILQKVVQYKIEGFRNLEIQKKLDDEFGSTHSLEYISSLWRKKIPLMIAEEAQNKFLNWYYSTVEQGQWKRCSCCGRLKLANNRYFSKNNTSKDGFYSICKECRNKKNKEMKLLNGKQHDVLL